MTLPWYKEGVHFSCTGCGKCCTGFPGYVWISDEEISALANHLRISDEEFRKKYTRMCYGRVSLKELKPHYDCIFLKNNQCSIYAYRPKQCRTFPFWQENMESRTSWDQLTSYCEGINRIEKDKISYETIVKELEN